MSFDFVRFKPVISEDILRVFWKQLLQILGFFSSSSSKCLACEHRLALSLTMTREANAEAQWSECLEQMTVEYSALNGTSVSTSPLPKPENKMEKRLKSMYVPANGESCCEVL